MYTYQIRYDYIDCFMFMYTYQLQKDTRILDHLDEHVPIIARIALWGASLMRLLDAIFTKESFSRKMSDFRQQSLHFVSHLLIEPWLNAEGDLD